MQLYISNISRVQHGYFKLHIVCKNTSM